MIELPSYTDFYGKLFIVNSLKVGEVKMRQPLKVKRYKIMQGDYGKKLFRLWFNRWATKRSICSAYHESNNTQGGDASQYTKALHDLGFLDSTKDRCPEKSKVIQKNKGDIRTRKVLWEKSSKKYESFRLNLNPFFEYLEKERNIELNEFDKHIINLVFESEKNREKAVNSGKDYFTSIIEVVFDYLRLPLGEIKTELLDYWTTEMHRVDAYIAYLNGMREKITFQEFKKMEKEIDKGRVFVYGELIGNSKENKIYQMILHVPNSFIKKMVKASTPQSFYNTWEKQYYNKF